MLTEHGPQRFFVLFLNISIHSYGDSDSPSLCTYITLVRDITHLRYKIRYSIFIVRSKSDNSQFNLLHCKITEKNNDKKTQKQKKRKISEVPEADRKP